MSAKMHHLFNIVAGFFIIWGGLTSVLASINYISFPVFILGLIAYGLNQGGRHV